MQRYRASWVVLAVVLAGCVDGNPVQPLEATSVEVLHRLVNQQADTLELRADSTYRVRRSHRDLWVHGRYWFWTNEIDYNFLCARPNSMTLAEPVPITCSVFELQPGELSDPFSVFLRDGASRVWLRIRQP